MSAWSITESDVLTITVICGDFIRVVRKTDMYYEPYDDNLVLVTFNVYEYNKFLPTPIAVKPLCFMYDWRECTYPIATDRDNLIVLLKKMLENGSDVKVQKNGTDVGQEPTLNFIEGTNITITAVDDPTNNKVDITIDASGGGGGVTSVTATGLLTSSGGTTPDISSQVNKGKLVGRNSVTAGIMEEITVGSGLTLSGTTLSANVNESITHATALGTDTYTATITGVTSYADGDSYLIRFTNGNTTGATLNINGIGAATLYRNNDGLLIGGDIVNGGEILCVYNAT
jgi:hypothetical protein